MSGLTVLARRAASGAGAKPSLRASSSFHRTTVRIVRALMPDVGLGADQIALWCVK